MDMFNCYFKLPEGISKILCAGQISNLYRDGSANESQEEKITSPAPESQQAHLHHVEAY